MYPGGGGGGRTSRSQKGRAEATSSPEYSYFIFGYIITKKRSGRFCMHRKARVYSGREGGGGGGGYVGGDSGESLGPDCGQLATC